MKSTGRIPTTHVGSLVRPPELVAFLKRQQNHEPYDAGAYEECLRRSVADVYLRTRAGRCFSAKPARPWLA